MGELSLTTSQAAALDHIRQYADTRRAVANSSIAHMLKMSNLGQDVFESAVSKMKSHARVALHFHPDRLDFKLHSVAEDLLASGIYKSQFETKLSNGSVSAHPGGERDLWEQKIFGGHYTFEKASVAERPKYGALDFAPSRWSGTQIRAMLPFAETGSLKAVYVRLPRFTLRSSRERYTRRT